MAEIEFPACELAGHQDVDGDGMLVRRCRLREDSYVLRNWHVDFVGLPTCARCPVPYLLTVLSAAEALLAEEPHLSRLLMRQGEANERASHLFLTRHGRVSLDRAINAARTAVGRVRGEKQSTTPG